MSSGKKEGFAFGRDNYIWLIIGVVTITVGYMLMVGGGSEDPNVFNPDMFNFQRLTLSPIVILSGIVVVIYAIMKKSKD